MSTTGSRKLPLWIILVFLLAISVYIAILSGAYQSMQKSLHQERAANGALLVEQITTNARTGIDSKWNNLHHFINMFSLGEYASNEEAVAEINMMHTQHPDPISGIFLVDEKNTCYFSDGNAIPWERLDLLAAQTDICFISTVRSRTSGDTTPYMFYLAPLKNAPAVDGVSFTHMGLYVDMRLIDVFFDASHYGGNSVSFIIGSDGTQIYRQIKSNPISGVHNVLSELSYATLHHGATHEQLVSDIAQGKSGFIDLTYMNGEYYLAYNALGVNDWMFLLMIPAENLGSASRDFMISIIVSILTIIAGAIVLLIGVLAVSSVRISRQRREVTAQLVKAAEAERSANNAKTQFLSSMSHDIRTPMNAIIGMTTLASRHIDDPAYVQSCLKKASLASNHLLTLINDVLDISKVEAGKMALNPTVFSLADAAANLTNIIRPQMEAKQHHFDVRVHNIRNEYLFADELRINQILINLLSNAIKYTPAGGKITLDLKEKPLPDAPGKMRLVCVVADDGVGMSYEFQQVMYNAFTRSGDQRAYGVQGTGLGLAICKQMVDLMEGSIACDSAPGRGTRFTVTLDLPIADRIVDDMTLPPMQVLLVDDDDVFLETAKSTLDDLGLDCDCVSSGVSAVRRVEDRRAAGTDYPLIIIDWKMPGMSGADTVRAIRDKVGKDVSIIVISAYEPESISAQALSAGADGFIAKPFFRSSVYQSISEIMGLAVKDESAEPRHAKSLKGLHVLIAEDNDLNWEIAHSLLSMSGITADRAENGEICIERMNASCPGEYDLILMDIQMPQLNGYAATRLLRTSQRADVRDIPIIAMTADAFADDVQKCLDAGMNAHIAKPINIEKLLEIIAKQLRA